MKLAFTIIIFFAIPVILGLILSFVTLYLLAERFLNNELSEPVPLYPTITRWESENYLHSAAIA